MQVKFIKFCPEAQTPEYASAGAAAADLRAVCPAEGVRIEPGARVLLRTGIGIELPGPEYVALVFARSSMGAKHGVALSNGVGVIDSDYRGEIRVGLVNLSDTAYTVLPGERVAQLAVTPVCRAEFVPAETLEETERGEGGFGSTGRM